MFFSVFRSFLSNASVVVVVVSTKKLPGVCVILAALSCTDIALGTLWACDDQLWNGFFAHARGVPGADSVHSSVL